MTPVLEARGLSRRVGSRILFRDLSLRLEAGGVCCVRGPSGSGKTQLLRMLAWLDRVDEGTIELHGRPPGAWGVPAWRAQVAYVPQGAPIVSGTPGGWRVRLAQLATHRGADGVDPRQIADQLSIPRSAWDQPWASLSGGERQRLHLALALATAPEVLLLDEPTAALDPALVQAVEELLAGRTAVWVTHDPAQAERLGAQVITLGTA